MGIKKYTQAEIAKLKELFKEFDVNGDGSIGREEVKISMQKFGINLTDGQIQNLFDAVDDDHSGELNFKEFTKLCLLGFNIQPTGDSEVDEPEDCEKLKLLFHEYDTDNSGAISSEQVKICMERFGVKLNDDQIQNLISAVDPNHEGKVEFKKYTKLCELAQGFEMIGEDNVLEEEPFVEYQNDDDSLKNTNSKFQQKNDSCCVML